MREIKKKIINQKWEGIGVASYLLIGYWTTRTQASKSANQAIIVNRVGDTILSVGFIVLIWATGSVEYAVSLAVATNLPEALIAPIALLLFGGAMSKSAQVPLHTWLPSAMEGPTPVSALIHAATLVTAGVYLMLRSSPILEYAPSSLAIISWVGALTAFFAASTGLIQNDLKRVIAYSTCSQLGYLFIAVGLAQYNAALFHLVGHAFFKALLFLAAGAVIHGMADQQDLRRLGGLASLIPFTYTAILIGSLSLIALPWLTGFYTKDAILELAGAQFTFSSSICYWSGTISAGLTAFYSFRLAGLSFFGSPSATRSDYEHAHEAPPIIIVPLVILSILAIGFGYLARDLYIGPGSDFLSAVLPQVPSHQALIEAEFGLTQTIKLLPAVLSIGGALLATWLYNASPETLNYLKESAFGSRVYRYLNNRWYLDTIISTGAIIPGTNIGLTMSKTLDRGLLELVGPYGLSTILPKTSQMMSRFDTGIITTYALAIMIGALSLILISFTPTEMGSGLNAIFVLLFIIGLVV